MAWRSVSIPLTHHCRSRKRSLKAVSLKDFALEIDSMSVEISKREDGASPVKARLRTEDRARRMRHLDEVVNGPSPESRLLPSDKQQRLRTDSLRGKVVWSFAFSIPYYNQVKRFISTT